MAKSGPGRRPAGAGTGRTAGGAGRSRTGGKGDGRSSGRGNSGPGRRPGRQRLAQLRAAQRRSERRRMLLLWGGLTVVVLGLVAGLTVASLGGNSHPSRGPEGVPLESGPVLATADSTTGGGTVDGISCGTTSAIALHIHTHLAVYVDGASRQIPGGIGVTPPRQVTNTSSGPFVVSGGCFYWLHTHTGDGIVHVESPVQRTFTLGNFFDIWRQPLSTNQVGPARGPVTAYVNGKRFTGDPRSIPLASHETVQLDVGTPVVSPKPVTFPNGL